MLKVSANNGEYLNFIFDSGANGFLLDSLTAIELGVITEDTKSAAAFMNGMADARFFINQSIFENEFLNVLYSRGECLSLNLWSERYGLKVDGLIGIGEHLTITASIDFENELLIITNKPFTPPGIPDEFDVLDMIYTDAGYERNYSRIVRQVPASRIKLKVSEHLEIETHVLFDTGFNRKFALLTAGNVDSIVNAINKPFTMEVKRTSLGPKLDSIYYTTAEAIYIANLDKNFATDIAISRGSVMAMQGFGTLEWMCLVGVEFLKDFSQIHFDIINRKIFIYQKQF